MTPRSPIRAALLAVLLAACAGSYSAWELERAERHFAAGRPEQALSHIERALRVKREDASERELALHVALLRALGREVEARAFADYAARHEPGERPPPAPLAPGADCRGSRDAAELVSAWGVRHLHVGQRAEPAAARFEIDARGRVGAIRVLRAGHPAAAWLIIRAVADARISPSRLERWRERERLPVSLCAWWDPRRQEPPVPPGGIPAGGCIRGFCTHAAGTAPHM